MAFTGRKASLHRGVSSVVSDKTPELSLHKKNLKEMDNEEDEDEKFEKKGMRGKKAPKRKKEEEVQEEEEAEQEEDDVEMGKKLKFSGPRRCRSCLLALKEIQFV